MSGGPRSAEVIVAHRGLAPATVLLGCGWVDCRHTKASFQVGLVKHSSRHSLPWAAIVIVQFFVGTIIQGNHLCSTLTGEAGFNNYPASWWQPLWALVQLVVVSVYA